MYKRLPIASNPLLPTQETTGDEKVTEQAIFSELYDRYAPVLLGVITKVVPDKATSVLALENTFSTIHAQVDQFPSSGRPLFTWLLTIARHTAIEVLKTKQSGTPATLKLSETGRVSLPTNHTLPVADKQTAMLDSVLFKNCTPEEAALSLNIPAEQARQQLRLAIQKLR